MNVGAIKGSIILGLVSLPLTVPLMVVTVPAVLAVKAVESLKK